MGAVEAAGPAVCSGYRRTHTQSGCARRCGATTKRCVARTPVPRAAAASCPWWHGLLSLTHGSVLSGCPYCELSGRAAGRRLRWELELDILLEGLEARELGRRRGQHLPPAPVCSSCTAHMLPQHMLSPQQKVLLQRPHPRAHQLTAMIVRALQAGIVRAGIACHSWGALVPIDSPEHGACPQRIRDTQRVLVSSHRLARDESLSWRHTPPHSTGGA
jgi:hypothetical protein